MSSDPPPVAARCRVKLHATVSQAALNQFFAGNVGRSAEDGNSPDFSALVPASEPVAQPCRLQDTSHEKGVSRRQEALSRSLCNSGPFEPCRDHLRTREWLPIARPQQPGLER